MPTNQYTVNAIRKEIESLRRSIKTLEELADRIERGTLEELADRIEREDDEETISVETATPVPSRRSTFLGVHDSQGKEIHVGDTVNFLSKGNFTSKTGEVYKISGNLRRVTSRDKENRSISRAPNNLKVVGETFLRA